MFVCVCECVILPRKSIFRLIDCTDITIAVYRGRKQYNNNNGIGGTSVGVPQCYMFLCPCVYGLQQYGRLWDVIVIITGHCHTNCF